MQRDALTTVNRAIKWTEESETKREVKFEHGVDWANKSFDRVWVYDNNSGLGAYLPIPFKGNISKFICQKEQEDLQKQLDSATERLARSVSKCKEMEE